MVFAILCKDPKHSLGSMNHTVLLIALFLAVLSSARAFLGQSLPTQCACQHTQHRAVQELDADTEGVFETEVLQVGQRELWFLIGKMPALTDVLTRLLIHRLKGRCL